MADNLLSSTASTRIPAAHFETPPFEGSPNPTEVEVSCNASLVNEDMLTCNGRGWPKSNDVARNAIRQGATHELAVVNIDC